MTNTLYVVTTKIWRGEGGRIEHDVTPVKAVDSAAARSIYSQGGYGVSWHANAGPGIDDLVVEHHVFDSESAAADAHPGICKEVTRLVAHRSPIPDSRRSRLHESPPAVRLRWISVSLRIKEMELT